MCVYDKDDDDDDDDDESCDMNSSTPLRHHREDRRTEPVEAETGDRFSI